MSADRTSSSNVAPARRRDQQLPDVLGDEREPHQPVQPVGDLAQRGTVSPILENEGRTIRRARSASGRSVARSTQLEPFSGVHPGSSGAVVRHHTPPPQTLSATRGPGDRRLTGRRSRLIINQSGDCDRNSSLSGSSCLNSVGFGCCRTRVFSAPRLTRSRADCSAEVSSLAMAKHSSSILELARRGAQHRSRSLDRDRVPRPAVPQSTERARDRQARTASGESGRRGTATAKASKDEHRSSSQDFGRSTCALGETKSCERWRRPGRSTDGRKEAIAKGELRATSWCKPTNRRLMTATWVDGVTDVFQASAVRPRLSIRSASVSS